jgi:hypothetical protein
MERDAATILNHAFVRVFRAFGQYVREACVHFEVGADSLGPRLERQHADAERLGTLLADRFGAVYTGTYPIAFGDIHFLNCSYIVGDWIRWQQQLVAGLEADRNDLARLQDPDLGLVDEILTHERDTLQVLSQLNDPAQTEPCAAAT